MKKSELKTGMWVEMRNGELYMVVKDVDTRMYGNQDIFFAGKSGFMTGDGYDELMMNDRTLRNSENYDIVKVHKKSPDRYLLSPEHKGELLWEFVKLS